MKALVGRLRFWWDGRTPRERQMLCVMALLLAITLVWLVVIRPLGAWREDAAEQRLRAEADLVAVRAGARQIGTVAAAPKSPADAQGLEPLVRQSAEAAGLAITTGMDPSGRLGFRISNGSTSAVFGWLATLRSTHGITVQSLGVVENTDATLQVEGSLSL